MPSAVERFVNFAVSTGQKLKTGPDQIVNDAIKNTYLISRTLKGMQASDVVQSGVRIIDRIQLSDVGTAQFYSPNDPFVIQNVSALREQRVEWRFIADYYSWEEHEVVLNSGDQQTFYKNLLKGKRQQRDTSVFNKMENAIWGNADNAEMENAGGKLPYSIPAFVTENTNGLPTGFTTVMGISPAESPNWDNQRESYDPTDLTNPDTGLVQAFDRMFMKVRFRAPRNIEQSITSDDLKQTVIATSMNGRAKWLRLTRDSNDRLVGNDLGAQQGELLYNGLPVEHFSGLDDKNFAKGREPYFFLNLKFMHPVWNSKKYFEESKPINHPLQPFSWVVWSNTFYNWFCVSRRRQGIVFAA